MDLEELDEDELEAFRRQYEKMAAAARKKFGKGGIDIDGPDPD